MAFDSPDFGGLGLPRGAAILDAKEEAKVLFLLSCALEALNSADRCKQQVPLLESRPERRRGMTLTEKIFAAHDVEHRGMVKPGDLIRVNVDWIMASEASWSGMEGTYNLLGKPGIFRNDRFWLAGDHVVDPRINEVPKVKALIEASERAHANFKMTEYQGLNFTIMHTEFCRQRAQPGMLIIGSDSHTCSGGSMGCLAIGLGAADVTMPLVTGETWFKVPETVNNRLVNAPRPGIGGKDVILYILKELKRNTVAADRVVEYSGPGLQHLSCDARFAIANMTTEFGGITGVFVPDQITYDFVTKRKHPRNKSDSHYYRPDDDAVYQSTYVIDLSQVTSYVALYQSPDNVVPVTDVEGKELDGCFIGACTTAEEDLVLGAMVLEIALKRGEVTVKKGKRKVVPGSRPILAKLRKLGLADIYEQAGFEVGIPGCSYCVGMGADRAGEGEVWLSSQHRNFENRMGKGSIGNLSSAVTVAASSLSMKITNPKSLLEQIDMERLHEILNYHPKKNTAQSFSYVEPGTNDNTESADVHPVAATMTHSSFAKVQLDSTGGLQRDNSSSHDVGRGKVQVLGDFIDTDALAPAEILLAARTPEQLGSHCLEHTHPHFRQRVKEGFNVVVAGRAFGCGSSREQTVTALSGAGVVAVIAKSFAFIYSQNQPNLGLLGITITDEAFYEKATDGIKISIDLEDNILELGSGEDLKRFAFQLSGMERELINVGGITNAFQTWGRKVWEVMCGERKIYGSEESQGSKASAGDVNLLGHTPTKMDW